jgi:hypothetical protein
MELYSSAYKLALKNISPVLKREQPNIVLRLHAFIRRQIDEGATDPLTIAADALVDLHANHQTMIDRAAAIKSEFKYRNPKKSAD